MSVKDEKVDNSVDMLIKDSDFEGLLMTFKMNKAIFRAIICFFDKSQTISVSRETCSLLKFHTQYVIHETWNT